MPSEVLLVPIMRRLLFIVFLFIALVGGFFLLGHSKEFRIFNTKVALTNLDTSQEEAKGLFTGQRCENAGRRPLAVMLAGDPEVRPLSGIGMADMVVEMPVSPDGITRLMAFFQCQEPQEIGSVRSARGSFLGLAKGYDTIFAHWGGEKDALEKLNAGVLDNIDALPNPYNAFYRKEGAISPHDGFTSFSGLWEAAQKLTYNLQFTLPNFTKQNLGGQTTKYFLKFKEILNISNESNESDKSNNFNSLATTIGIPYPGNFRVEYRYDSQKNLYLRFKGGTPELDSLTKSQVQAKNIVIVSARIYPTYSQYVEVGLDGGRGKIKVFQGGQVIDGFWEKNSFSHPLLFYDTKGSLLELEPGVTWVEIVG